MRKITALLLVFTCSTLCLAQTKGKTSHRYEKMNVNYKKDYNNATFILDYIFSDALSFGDRYTQSVTVTDSIVTLKYVAPDFKSYNDTVYKKQFKLEPKELDSLKSVIKKSNLKQLKPGIARYQNISDTREILIVKCDEIQIAGGQTYRSLDTYPSEVSDDDAEKEIEKNRKDSSSIGGDYDSVINILKKYFKNVEEPHKDLGKH